jgi:hypothetical protein
MGVSGDEPETRKEGRAMFKALLERPFGIPGRIFWLGVLAVVVVVLALRAVLGSPAAPIPTAASSATLEPTVAPPATLDSRSWGVEFPFTPPVSEEFPWNLTGTWGPTHYFTDEFDLVGDELVWRVDIDGGNEVHRLIGNVPLADFLTEFALCLSGVNYLASNENGGAVYYSVLTAVEHGNSC